jgi:hypothetical protein
MADATPSMNSSFAEMPMDEWLEAVEAVAEEDGYFQPVGKKHYAIFVERQPTLLVSFETVQGMRALSALSQPLGWDMVRDHDWSHLCIASDGDTWFRDTSVYTYFDRLIDDGFFDEFEQVIFYGAGPCAYAAAAFSVASPGAHVMAIQPQATLDPRVTEWDDRFTDMRRTDFTSRYGYAPDMLDAAEEVFVLYDPHVVLDAMHAALFTRPNVTKLRLPHMGGAVQTDLLEMELLEPLLLDLAEGALSEITFAEHYRTRRNYTPYLFNLLTALERRGHPDLMMALCENVSTRLRAPKFGRKLARMRAAREAREHEESEATTEQEPRADRG